MARKSNNTQLQKRDWAIIALFILLLLSNLLWYKALDNHSKSLSELKQYSDDILKCSNEKQEPCDARYKFTD